jgi:hypothetical protein
MDLTGDCAPKFSVGGSASKAAWSKTPGRLTLTANSDVVHTADCVISFILKNKASAQSAVTPTVEASGTVIAASNMSGSVLGAFQSGGISGTSGSGLGSGGGGGGGLGGTPPPFNHLLGQSGGKKKCAGFTCDRTSRCLPMNLVCNGQYDCGVSDNSDERRGCQEAAAAFYLNDY